MADNLSPLVNLDLVNQIYRTINAQISERVYDPTYYSAAKLGDDNYRYVNAYLKALNVSGDVTITGNITGVKNISATTFNNLTLKANTTGFEVSGGTTSKKLTVSAATEIIKELTVGADNTGTVTIKSAGAGNTTIVGPSGATAQFNVATTVGGSSANTGSVTIQSSGNNPTTIQGPNGKTAAFKVATTIGADSTYTGDVEIKSAGTRRTTIIGPSNDTAKFLVNTTIGDTTKTGAVTIKSNGTNGTTIVGPDNSAASFLTSTTIGSSTNTGAVSIQPSGAKSLTINGPSDGVPVNLVSGNYQNSAVTECSTTSSANKIVQRDSNKDIQVRKVNGVELSSADTGFTAAGGTAPRTLKVNSAATLGSTASGETGDVVVKSEGVKTTTIVGPNDGTAKLKNGTCVVEADLPNVTVGSATTATINSWTDNEIHYLATVKASGENQGISAETDSTKKLYIERKTVDNATTYHFYAGAVHNAVWNDLADCIEVPEDTDLEFGYCYTWNGNKVEKTSRKSKNCIGIHSNTAGLFMGEKPVRTIQAAVAGFALAYTDKIYPEGTPLTWSDDGKLTKCTVLKRVLHPERVIATFYKEEKQESWHGVKVNNRHWVKIR